MNIPEELMKDDSKFNLAPSLNFYLELTNQTVEACNTDLGLIAFEMLYSGLAGQGQDVLNFLNDIYSDIELLAQYGEQYKLTFESLAKYFTKSKAMDNLNFNTRIDLATKEVHTLYMLHHTDITVNGVQDKNKVRELQSIFNKFEDNRFIYVDNVLESNLELLKQEILKNIPDTAVSTKIIVGPIQFTSNSNGDLAGYTVNTNTKILTLVNNIKRDSQFSEIEFVSPNLVDNINGLRYLTECLHTLPKFKYLRFLLEQDNGGDLVSTAILRTEKGEYPEIARSLLSPEEQQLDPDTLSKTLMGQAIIFSEDETEKYLTDQTSSLWDTLSFEKKQNSVKKRYIIAYLAAKYGADFDLGNDGSNRIILSMISKLFTANYAPFTEHLYRCSKLVGKDIAVTGAQPGRFKYGTIQSVDNVSFTQKAIPLNSLLTGQHFDVNMLYVETKSIDFKLEDIVQWEDFIDVEFIRTLNRKIFHLDSGENLEALLEEFFLQVQKAVITKIADEPVKLSNICLVRKDDNMYVTPIKPESYKVTVNLDNGTKIRVAPTSLVPMNAFSFASVKGKFIDTDIVATAETINILAEIEFADVSTFVSKLKYACNNALKGNDEMVRKYIREAMIILNNLYAKPTNTDAYKKIKAYNEKGLLQLLKYDYVGNISGADISV